MKLYKKTLIFIFLFSFSISSFSQSITVVDSLINRLKYMKDDTSKALLYDEIMWNLLFASPDSALYYFEKGVKLSEKLNYHNGLAHAYNYRAILYTISSEFKKAFSYYNKSIVEFSKSNN